MKLLNEKQKPPIHTKGFMGFLCISVQCSCISILKSLLLLSLSLSFGRMKTNKRCFSWAHAAKPHCISHGAPCGAPCRPPRDALSPRLSVPCCSAQDIAHTQKHRSIDIYARPYSLLIFTYTYSYIPVKHGTAHTHTHTHMAQRNGAAGDVWTARAPPIGETGGCKVRGDSCASAPYTVCFLIIYSLALARRWHFHWEFHDTLVNSVTGSLYVHSH